jgi:hypothetical protein
MANQSATWAEWDLELVAQEIADLKSLDFDLDLTGFNPGEIDDFLFRDPQDLPEQDLVDVPGEPTTRLGTSGSVGLIACWRAMRLVPKMWPGWWAQQLPC